MNLLDKLVATDRAEKLKCANVNCEKYFYVATKGSRARNNKVRQRGSKTCCRACSRIYLRDQEKRYSALRNNRNI